MQIIYRSDDGLAESTIKEEIEAYDEEIRKEKDIQLYCRENIETVNMARVVEICNTIKRCDNCPFHLSAENTAIKYGGCLFVRENPRNFIGIIKKELDLCSNGKKED